jgi:hypothetical protein
MKTLVFNMSNIQIVKTGNESVEPTVSSVTGATTAVTSVSTKNTILSSVNTAVENFFQKVPNPNIEDFLTRFVEIDSWPLTSAQTAVSEVDSLDPWALFLANPAVADKVANFSLIRGTIELLFEVNTPAGSYGSYCLSAFCLGGNGGIDPLYDVGQILEPANCMQVDHYSRIDCAAAENAVFQLPWMWPYDFADVINAPPSLMWKVLLFCLSPMRAGIDGGPTNGNIRVFARLLPGYQLCVPHFQGKRKGALVPNSTTQRHLPEVHKKLTDYKVSEISNIVGDVADKLHSVPIIGAFASTAATAAHAFGSLASAFGFTRESDERHPLPIVNRSVTNLAHVDGADSSDSASLMRVAEISIDATLAGGTTEDVASYSSLFKRWTLLDNFTWDSTQVVGTDLNFQYVSPFTARRPAVGIINPGIGGYVGAMFDYWRGDMEYLLIIPCSKFHRGTLQVYWAPFGSGSANPITNVTMNVIIDIAAGEEHAFKVGFARDAPYLQKAWITDDIAIVPISTCNGQIRFRVVNPLASQNATSSVNCFIFARPGQNMDFQLASTSSVYPNPADVPAGYVYSSILNGFRYQGNGALGDDGDNEPNQHELVSSSGDYPGETILWGEKISSVRALMQKPSRVLWRAGDAPNVGTFIVMAPLGPIPFNDAALTNDSILNRVTWAGWYRVVFVGIASSERYKFIPRKGVFLGAAPCYTPLASSSTNINNFTSTLAPVTWVGPNLGAEISIPYYQPQKYLAARRYYTHSSANYIARQNAIYLTQNSNIVEEVVFYHSLGPDLRIVGFLQVPRVQFTGAPVLAYTFWQYPPSS